jgi:hypothetical protein
MFDENHKKTKCLANRARIVMGIVERAVCGISKTAIAMEDDMITKACMEAGDIKQKIQKTIQSTMDSVFIVLSWAEFMINETDKVEKKARKIYTTCDLHTRNKIICTAVESTESAIYSMDIAVRALDIVVDAVEMIAKASDAMEKAFEFAWILREKEMRQATERTPEELVEYVQHAEESNQKMTEGLAYVRRASDTMTEASAITEIATKSIVTTSKYMKKVEDIMMKSRIWETGEEEAKTSVSMEIAGEISGDTMDVIYG